MAERGSRPIVTIVGLGPGSLGGLSVSAFETLTGVPRVLLRTRRHPVVDDLEARGMTAESFDALYEAAGSFDELYDRIAGAVLDEARAGDVVYAVPGSPMLGERTVSFILERCEAEGIPVTLVPSVSSLDAVLAVVRVAVNDALEILHAPDAARFRPEGVVPLFIFGLYDAATASDTKLALMAVYPDDYPVTVVRGAGIEGAQSQETIPLYRLDRVAVDHLTSVYVPPMEHRPVTSFERLLEVMDALRAPDGCPWDREQDHQTLKKYLTEETYEFFDAVDDDDDERMADELGDLLLQIVFHAQIAKEEDRFDIHDSIRSIVEKLIRRHPHVFGEVEVTGSEQVLENWEKIKARERLTAHRKSLLDAVPRSMPALQRAYELTRRAAKVGFDWEDAPSVLEKVREETEEAREALASGDADAIRHEVGDLLFALANLARKAGVDPEDALHGTNRRFGERFRYIETSAEEQGRPLAELSLAEMDALWNEAKARET